MNTQNPTPDATPTPRTNEAVIRRFKSWEICDRDNIYVEADFARTLEHELTAAKAEICELNAWKTGKKGIEDHYREVGELQSDNAALRAEVERLKAQYEAERCLVLTCYDQLRGLRGQLKAKVLGIPTTENCVAWADKAIAAEAERDQLRARVDKLEQQMQVAKTTLSYYASDWGKDEDRAIKALEDIKKLDSSNVQSEQQST